jgi:serine/threonine protein kinase
MDYSFEVHEAIL